MTDVLSVVSAPPVTVERSRTIGEAAQEMDRHGVGALLVTDDSDHLVGIVTDRDIVLRGVARGVPMEASVDRLMTTEVFTLSADVELAHAYEVFRDHALRRLPVLDGDRIVGVLSADDLLIRDARRIEGLVRPLAQEVIARHRRTPVGAGEIAHAGDGVIASRRLVRAHPGDTLVIHGRTLGRPDRFGEILEVRSPSGDPPFLVSWSDSDHVSFTYPGPDAEVRPRGEQETATAGGRAGNGSR
ncbi:CBS domain-containing protein [Candidatus Protofrankia californiensis]|uniref:CBS domain-containing protein n=1 Tax=Candidatus Protofrankia californiensis TaxID=1839754 RepID=UPI0010418357|nr:CBS domain-containing protein [Candidatus Protofrankia californiensis]